MNMDYDSLFNVEGFATFPDIFPLNPPDLLPPSNEIALLNTELEKLSLDVHTQSLRVKIEKVKRQKLRSKLKRVRQDMIPQNRILTQVHRDFNTLRENMEIA